MDKIYSLSQVTFLFVLDFILEINEQSGKVLEVGGSLSHFMVQKLNEMFIAHMTRAAEVGSSKEIGENRFFISRESSLIIR